MQTILWYMTPWTLDIDRGQPASVAGHTPLLSHQLSILLLPLKVWKAVLSLWQIPPHVLTGLSLWQVPPVPTFIFMFVSSLSFPFYNPPLLLWYVSPFRYTIFYSPRQRKPIISLSFHIRLCHSHSYPFFLAARLSHCPARPNSCHGWPTIDLSMLPPTLTSTDCCFSLRF